MTYREQVEAAGFINDYDVLAAYTSVTGAPMPPAVVYRPIQSGRWWRPAAWQVYRPWFVTDPDPRRHWLDNGLMTFTVHGRAQRAAQLSAALEWAGARFGVTEWVKVPGLRTTGAYFPKPVADWFKAYIRSGGVNPDRDPAEARS